MVLVPHPSVRFFAACFVILLLLIAFSQIPWRFFLQRCSLALPLILFIAVPLLLVRDGGRVILVGGIGIDPKGISRVLEVVLKAILSVISVTLLVSTTPFPDLLKGAQYLKMPKLFVALLSFMYRYFFLFSDEAMRLNLARSCRTITRSSRWSRLKSAGNIVGVLFLRSYERSGSIYLSMLSRGFAGEIRTMSRFRITAQDWLFVLAMLAYCSFVTIYA
jgi:cobalt/nickel transport system permease protein